MGLAHLVQAHPTNATVDSSCRLRLMISFTITDLCKMSQSHIISALLLLLLLLPCYHSARILNDFPSAAAVTHLGLPCDELRLSPEKHSGGLPCEMGVSNRKYPESHRLPGKYYRPLYLNHVLPKGTVTGPGPIKGINDVNN